MIVERQEASAAALDQLAQLRIAVFADYPYLYQGDLAYERRYLQSYYDRPQAVLIVARDGDQIVGAATGMPLADHADAASLSGPCPPKDQVFYCAESVLLPAYRGRGVGHAFFDQREAAARAGGFRYSLFCAVIRRLSHPGRPEGYRPLDPFWRKRGYVPIKGLTATFHWTDIGDTSETAHCLQGWMRELEVP